MFGMFKKAREVEQSGPVAVCQSHVQEPMLPARRVTSVGGDLLQCARARRNGACGVDSACSTCAIRMSVLQTRVTGEPQQNIVTYQDVETPEGNVKHVRIMFDVWRFDDTVELRVQDVLTIVRPSQEALRMAQMTG